MPWVLNLVYAALIAAAMPFLLYRRVRQGKYRTGWNEKLLGSVPELPAAGERVWFHAVSVGEVLLLRGTIAELRARRPGLSVVVTTTTETGYDLARKQYPDLVVSYCPLDFSWAVRRAIERLKPTALVLAELELWPNLIHAASRAGVRLAIVNGRLSENSFKGYRKLRPLIARLLGRFDLIAAQSVEYAARFRALGAPRDRVVTTGSVKFDGAGTDRNNPQTTELRRAFGIAEGEIVFIAGSTQAPEEEFALATWRELRGASPNLRLILVPRHKERFEEVAELARRSGLPVRRRTEVLNGHPLPDGRGSDESVLLLDTLGELGACWGLADVAFVGGSLTNRGGQNMIEPAAYGAAVLFGPDTRNFKDAVSLLLAADAAKVVADGAELTVEVRRLVTDREARSAMGGRARTAVSKHRGAMERTVDLLVSNVLIPASSVVSQNAA